MMPPGNIDGDGEGEGDTPRLLLAGYSGSLADLLILARTRRIDLAKIPVLDLVDQLALAVRDAPAMMALSQKGDWVVMAAWLLQLRSLLLLPADAPAHRAARDEAERLQNRLAGLDEMQALAAWLERRPQLGQDVFARGQPAEEFGSALGATPEIDIIEFLWASMALFDDDLPRPDLSEKYVPRWRDLYSIAEARARILQYLAQDPDGLPLEQLLPRDLVAAGISVGLALKTRAAWTSTFIASLELAKQGEVALEQAERFAVIHVSPTPADPPV